MQEKGALEGRVKELKLHYIGGREHSSFEAEV